MDKKHHYNVQHNKVSCSLYGLVICDVIILHQTSFLSTSSLLNQLCLIKQEEQQQSNISFMQQTDSNLLKQEFNLSCWGAANKCPTSFNVHYLRLLFQKSDHCCCERRNSELLWRARFTPFSRLCRINYVGLCFILEHRTRWRISLEEELHICSQGKWMSDICRPPPPLLQHITLRAEDPSVFKARL